jgi:gamma-tubulin complex component 2
MQVTIIFCNALQGDFIVQFLDLTENELRKQVDDLNPVRLESLLELALRTSSSTTDPYKDSVKVELFAYGIREQMLSIMRIETPLEDHKVRIYYFLTRS